MIQAQFKATFYPPAIMECRLCLSALTENVSLPVSPRAMPDRKLGTEVETLNLETCCIHNPFHRHQSWLGYPSLQIKFTSSFCT
jgi:hypothetical protein